MTSKRLPAATNGSKMLPLRSDATEFLAVIRH